MAQLVEKIPALVGNAFMLPLQHRDGFMSIGTTFLCVWQHGVEPRATVLGAAVPSRMRNMFALAGGDKRREPNINPDIDTRRGERRGRNFTRYRPHTTCRLYE